MAQGDRVALVTGGNKGIGLEIARQLAQVGVLPIIGAREAARGEAAVQSLSASGLTARTVSLDVDDQVSIAMAAERIAREHGKLDILVNNAGIFDPGDAPPSKAAHDAVRRVMNTNFCGALAVTQAMLPLLHKAPAGRIVNVSSSLGSLTLNGDPSSTYYGAQYIGYNASKAALNMFTVDLAYDLRDTKVKVNSVCPGYTATDLNNHSGHQTIQEGAEAIVRVANASEKDSTGTFIHKDGT